MPFGFLIYNFNPATIFLGDTGSLFIGFLLGCYGIIWSQKSATLLGMTAPLMLLAIPMLDIALSILRRFVRHAPIMQADHGHIHHKLLEKGFSIRGAVLLLYALFGFAAMFSLIQSAAGRRYGGIVIVAFCVCFPWQSGQVCTGSVISRSAWPAVCCSPELSAAACCTLS